MHCVCCSIIAWVVECTKKSQPEIMFRKHIKKSKDWIRCFRIKTCTNNRSAINDLDRGVGTSYT